MNAILMTASGHPFDAWNPEPTSVEIGDIAHALSAMPRFAGHTRDFYPVAQHAVWVSHHVPPSMALYGLLKDAPHAYLMDLLGPYKREVVDYTAAEARLAHAVHHRFGLDPFLSTNKMLGAIDDLALLVEWRDQKDASLSWWEVEPERISNLETEEALSPMAAKQAFLDRFEELVKGGAESRLHTQARTAIKELRGWRPPLRPEIVTWHGHSIDPMDPDPAQVDIRDMARSLSRIPRFAGHTREPYSVAEHLVFVAERCVLEEQMKGLLHDGAEYLFLDVPAPVKKNLPAYREMENHAQRRIMMAFGQDPAVIKPPSVKAADLLSCQVEMRDLLNHSRGWLPPEQDNLDHIPTIVPIGHEAAEARFIQKYEELAQRPLPPKSSWGPRYG